MANEQSHRLDSLLIRVVVVLAVLLVAQSAVSPVVATGTPYEDTLGACVETRPAGAGGVPVTVERGPVENSVTLSITPVAARTVQDSLWGIVLPDGTSLYSKTGFKPNTNKSRLFQPVENAPNYSLTYTYEEDGTFNGTSLNGVTRPFEATDEWAIAPLPRHYNGLISYQTPEEAVIGQQTVYFGDYTMTTVSNGCHRIQLVVPRAVHLNRNQTAILDSLLYTDRHLGGQRYDEVTIFVSPERLDSYEGVARESDIVISGPRVAEYGSRTHIWLHEYVHTRQTYSPESDFAWWTEASANYLSIRMGLRSGYLQPRQYNEILSEYGENETDDAVLANASTWQNFSTYKRGVLALARLDATLRTDTNRSVTVVTVFNATEAKQPRNLTEFTAVLENESGNGYENWTANYITGTKTDELPMKADTPSLSARVIDVLTPNSPITVGLYAILLLTLIVAFRKESKDAE